MLYKESDTTTSIWLILLLILLAFLVFMNYGCN
ncbi:hypothetical protein EDD75_1543 [Thermodesulfitimonas autotrophica]|uniref:Uncharacterized protein n=1 Tax=Thermodesulfitimonas autotrophica TaxID=1894989 RepID=A0A3N5B0S2_9THEO|nr:hypothetical protein EDD75_1543 [Thermodesulfitimonas autotrophica]